MGRFSEVYLIAHPRSGTHALASLLAENSNLVHLGEVFNFGGAKHKENYFFFVGALQSPALTLPQNAGLRFWTYLKYLQHMWPQRPILLDMKYDVLHLFDGATREPHSAPKIFDLLKERGEPTIHLTRNLLHICFSVTNAIHTQQWHVTAAEVRKRQKWVVDPDYVLAFLHQKSFEQNQVKRYMARLTNAIEVDYDQVFRESGDDRRRLFEFLGITDRGRPSSFKKQIDLPYSEVIENYAEIVKAVRNSPFARLLEDGERDDMTKRECELGLATGA